MILGLSRTPGSCRRIPKRRPFRVDEVRLQPRPPSEQNPRPNATPSERTRRPNATPSESALRISEFQQAASAYVTGLPGTPRRPWSSSRAGDRITQRQEIISPCLHQRPAMTTSAQTSQCCQMRRESDACSVISSSAMSS